MSIVVDDFVQRAGRPEFPEDWTEDHGDRLLDSEERIAVNLEWSRLEEYYSGPRLRSGCRLEVPKRVACGAGVAAFGHSGLARLKLKASIPRWAAILCSFQHFWGLEADVD